MKKKEKIKHSRYVNWQNILTYPHHSNPKQIPSIPNAGKLTASLSKETQLQGSWNQQFNYNFTELQLQSWTRSFRTGHLKINTSLKAEHQNPSGSSFFKCQHSPVTLVAAAECTELQKVLKCSFKNVTWDTLILTTTFNKVLAMSLRYLTPEHQISRARAAPHTGTGST